MAGSRPAGYNGHVDFPHALRERRTRRHLSQLEIALRAGTTQRHLSFIESGRSAPGRNMVVRLAESLELPLREHNELLLAAGYAPAIRRVPSTTRPWPRRAPRSTISSRVICLTRRSSWTEMET
jgi:transcriptional regulator with XRE-family HTH domain